MILEMTRPVQGGLRQERKLEAVSNNIANSDTNGFKKDRVSFDSKFRAQINKDFSAMRKVHRRLQKKKRKKKRKWTH